jgi:hypothetical protein
MKLSAGLISTTLVCVQMAISPLAMGAEAKTRVLQITQVQRVRELLKVTEFGARKDLTVGEFYQKVRDQYPEEFQAQMDPWVLAHRKELMPKLQTSTYKDSQGREQVRLMMTDKSGQMTVATMGAVENPSVKINEVVIDSTIAPEKYLETVISKDSKLKEAAMNSKGKAPALDTALDTVPSYHEFNNLTAMGKAQYFLNLRITMELAQQILEKHHSRHASTGANYGSIYAFLALVEAAFAVAPGQSCIVAGWVSQYSENTSCGGVRNGREDLDAQIGKLNRAFPGAKGCSGSMLPCNPMVYGFDRGGQMYCVPSQPKSVSNVATTNCEAKSPLGNPPKTENKERIAKSWLEASAGGGPFDTKDGKVSKDSYAAIEKYLADLSSVAADARQTCAQDLLSDQKPACEALAKRTFTFEQYDEESGKLAVAPVPTLAASQAVADKKLDELPTPEVVKPEEQVKAPEIPEQKPEQKAEEKKGGLMGWIGGLPSWVKYTAAAGAGLLAGYLIWGRKKKPKTKTVYKTNTVYKTVYTPVPLPGTVASEGGTAVAPANPTSPPRVTIPGVVK